ncbi:MAG: Ig-like domain-containing protein [Reichenbachiella sp.]
MMRNLTKILLVLMVGLTLNQAKAQDVFDLALANQTEVEAFVGSLPSANFADESTGNAISANQWGGTWGVKIERNGIFTYTATGLTAGDYIMEAVIMVQNTGNLAWIQDVWVSGGAVATPILQAGTSGSYVTYTSTVTVPSDGDYKFGIARNNTGGQLYVQEWSVKKDVPAVAVTGVTLDDDLETISIGDDYTLTETIAPVDATNQAVTWSSSDEAVATVTDGVVSGLTAGTSTITVTTVDGSFTDTFEVTVEAVAVTGVALDDDVETIDQGLDYTLTATISPANATVKTVTWSSDDEAVATVIDGIVTGVAPGSATITVSTTDGSLTDTFVITVEGATAVTSVSLDDDAETILDGGQYTLTETVLPVDATIQTVTWSSDDEAVATVADGVVTSVGVGTATITVTTDDGGFTATFEITVDPIVVTDVTLDPTTETVFVGSTVQLTETVLPVNATDKSVTWSSSSDAIATVDAEGLVTGVTEGEVTITATSVSDGGVTGTSTVTVEPAPVYLFQVNLANSGEVDDFIASMPANFASSGTVESNSWAGTAGLKLIGESELTYTATALKAGEYIIEGVFMVQNPAVLPMVYDVWATDGTAPTPAIQAEGVANTFTSFSKTVTVPSDGDYTFGVLRGAHGSQFFIREWSVEVGTPAVSSENDILTFVLAEQTSDAAIDPENHTVDIIVASETDVSTLTPTITISDDATISPDTGVERDFSASVTYTVTAEDETTQDWTVNVSLFVDVTGVSLDDDVETIGVGGTHTLTATVLPVDASNKAITWSSDDEAVATVVDGVVSAVGEGSATITVTTDDGSFTDTFVITVDDPTPVVSVSLDDDVETILEGEQYTLTETVLPLDATIQTVTWSSGDEAVATVLDGVVTGVSVGSTTITVTTDDGGFTADFVITVDPVPVTGVSITPSTASIKATLTVQLVTTVLPENATDKSVTWSSSDEGIATVDSEGLVTGVAEGQVTITATSVSQGDVIGTSTVTVAPAPVYVFEMAVANQSESDTFVANLPENFAVTGTATSEQWGGTYGVKLEKSSSLTYTATDLEAGEYHMTGVFMVQNTANLSWIQDAWATNGGTISTGILQSGTSTTFVTYTETVTLESDGDYTFGVVRGTDGGQFFIQEWSVEVGEIFISSDNDIVTFAFAEQSEDAIIDPDNHTVNIKVNSGTDVSALTPTISISESATINPLSGIEEDFSSAVAYTVTAEDGTPQEWTVNVSIVVDVASVSLDDDAETIGEGDEYTLTATIAPIDADNQNVSWSTSDEDIATVVDGEVTAVGGGTAIITVTTEDGGFTDTFELTVTVAATGVSLDSESGVIAIGNDVTIVASVEPFDATNQNIAWSTSDAGIASVVDGVVTAEGIGEATITVTTEDGGFTDTFLVTVQEAVISVTGVTLDDDSETLTEGDGYNLVATIAPVDATNQNVTWSTSDALVATVVNGVVTAEGAGTATITVTTQDGAFTDTFEVTVESLVIAVTGVMLDKESETITVEEALTLIATVAPIDATNQNVTWSTNDALVATVVNGVVTAEGAGTAIITVTTQDGAFTDSFEVTVENLVINVTGVTLDKESETITVEEALTLIATVAPVDATNQNVTWSTNAAAIATVDNGVVTGVGGGSAIITVTTEDGSFTDTFEVTVTVAVTGVILDSESGIMAVGNDVTIVASVEPFDATNQNIAWSTSDAGIASVVDGVVTAEGIGEATITVTTEDGGFIDTFLVTVQEAVISVTGVTLDDDSETLTEGDGYNLVATVAPVDATNQNVTWSTSDALVATVVNGAVTAEGAGTAIITVTTQDGAFTDTFEVTVESLVIAVTGVTLDKESETITVDEALTLIATVAPIDATNQNVTWSTNTAAIATVVDGVVTGVGVGSAIITVTTEDGSFTDTFEVTIQAETITVSGVSLDVKEGTIEIGDTQTLTASVLPLNATNQNVTWSTSDEAIATVLDGVVTGVAVGVATITVTTDEGGITDTFEATIIPARIAVTGVTLDKESETIIVDEELTLIATVAPMDASNQNVLWNTSDAAIASVIDGVVTGVAVGVATITVESIDGGFTATFVVTVENIALGFTNKEVAEIGVYPNPASSVLNFDNINGFHTASIVDLMGKKVFRTSVYSTGKIDVSTLENGIYLLLLSNDNESVTTRIVIRH